MPRPLRYDPDNDYYTVLGVAPTATLDEIQRFIGVEPLPFDPTITTELSER